MCFCHGELFGEPGSFWDYWIRVPRCLNLGVNCTNIVALSCTWEYWWQNCQDIAAFITTRGDSGNMHNMFGNTSDHCTAVQDNQHFRNCYQCIWLLMLLLVFKPFWNRYIQFVFSSRSLCDDVSVLLPLHICFIWFGCWQWLRAISDVPEDGDEVNIGLLLDVMIMGTLKL